MNLIKNPQPTTFFLPVSWRREKYHMRYLFLITLQVNISDSNQWNFLLTYECLRGRCGEIICYFNKNFFVNFQVLKLHSIQFWTLYKLIFKIAHNNLLDFELKLIWKIWLIWNVCFLPDSWCREKYHPKDLLLITLHLNISDSD